MEGGLIQNGPQHLPHLRLFLSHTHQRNKRFIVANGLVLHSREPFRALILLNGQWFRRAKCLQERSSQQLPVLSPLLRWLAKCSFDQIRYLHILWTMRIQKGADCLELFWVLICRCKSPLVYLHGRITDEKTDGYVVA